MIYFAQESVSGFIKIGSSKHPQQRVAAIANGYPGAIQIIALEAGSHAYERGLHRRFRLSHVRGEWFHPSPELMQYIGTLPPLDLSASDVEVSDPQSEVLGRKALTALLRKAAISPSHASRLVRGTASPSLDLAISIEKITGLPPMFWRSENRAAAMWARIQEGHK